MRRGEGNQRQGEEKKSKVMELYTPLRRRIRGRKGKKKKQKKQGRIHAGH